MATRHTLVLTDDERMALEQVRDRDARPYLREKAAALLKIADGQAAYQVVLTGLHKPRQPDTVYGWLRDWQQERTVKVRPAYRGPFSPHDPERQATLDILHCPLPDGTFYWTLAKMQQFCPALSCLRTLGGVCRRLAKWKVGRKRARLHLVSPDPLFADKQKAIARVR